MGCTYMSNKSVYTSLDVSKKDFADQLRNKAQGMTALEFAATFKDYTTEDFRIICSEWGIPYKARDSRIVLLTRIYYHVNPRDTGNQVITQS